MNKKTIGALLGASALVLVCGAAQASAPGGNAAKGKEKAAACAACHGEDGNSKSGEFPRLAGQNQDYLYFALNQYKTKQRKNPIMGGFVATLKKEDLADLAAYFASQKGLEYKY
jgi:cytochrome c553